MKHHCLVIGVSLGVSLASFSSFGWAQDEAPKGLMKEATASAGKEDVATSGFEAQAKAAADAKDVTELKISAGGLAAGGNSRSISATAAGKFRVRQESNQLSLAAAANYGRSAPSPTDSVQTTVENFQGKSRYDRFLSGSFAMFGAVSGLRDRFQGLDLRLNVDPGIAYYFVDEAKQQLWGELGYDLQYDVRRKENLDAEAAKGDILEKTEVRHSGRGFVGYSNTLSQTATLDTGLEYLQAVSETKNWRVNWNVSLTSQIAGNFSIAAAFSLKYDNNPLPSVKNTDYLSSLSLVYQLL
jgi:putative salt-induced outer membrane protein